MSTPNSSTPAVHYIKIRFRKGERTTAGLVIPWERYKTASIQTISRLFPNWEVGVMFDLQCSPVYDDWEKAFLHDFDAPKGGAS